VGHKGFSRREGRAARASRAVNDFILDLIAGIARDFFAAAANALYNLVDFTYPAPERNTTYAAKKNSPGTCMRAHLVRRTLLNKSRIKGQPRRAECAEKRLLAFLARHQERIAISRTDAT